MRELNNETERAASLTVDNRVELSDLSTRIVPDGVRFHFLGTEPLISRDGTDAPREETSTTQNYSLQEMECELILGMPNKTDNNRSKAAGLLSITREGLRKKLLRMGINGKELPHDDGKV